MNDTQKLKAMRILIEKIIGYTFELIRSDTCNDTKYMLSAANGFLCELTFDEYITLFAYTMDILEKKHENK